MDTEHSTSDGTVAFYLPATFQFSRAPGRIERFLARHLRSRDATLSGGGTASGPGFFLPATPAVRRR